MTHPYPHSTPTPPPLPIGVCDTVARAAAAAAGKPHRPLQALRERETLQQPRVFPGDVSIYVLSPCSSKSRGFRPEFSVSQRTKQPSAIPASSKSTRGQLAPCSRELMALAALCE